MNGMGFRAAQALAAAKGGAIVDEVDEAMFRRDSQAVIASLREPTPEMLAAGWKAFRGDRPGPLIGPGPAFKEAWQAMIDAALPPSPSPSPAVEGTK